jgi:hypothetical protein
MTAEEQTAFRGRKVWKDFRASLIKERGCRCELCWRPKQPRALQVHHLTPDEYDNLEPRRFSVLCSDDHELIEKWSRRLGAANFGTKQNPKPPDELLDQWLTLVGPHLSMPARQIWREWKRAKAAGRSAGP